MNKKTPRKVSAAFVETEVDGERVIMQIDKGYFFTLNETSEAIWNNIDGASDIDGIVDAVSLTFDVSPDECANDVEAFISELVEHKLIELS